jgi:hypothetical protein
MDARTVVTLALALFLSPVALSSQKSEPPPTAEHEDAIRRAQVWLAPAVPIERARLGENPPGPDSFSPDQEVVCTFKPAYMGGSTPKFDCELPDGDKVKVKYGRDNAEIYAEVAGSRLLNALGFPADRMYVVKRVRCYGCSEDPYRGMQCLNEGGDFDACFRNVDYDKYHDFDDAVIERSVKGKRIETDTTSGWTWFELAKIDPAAGGAPRAHIDALRLLAIFLGHWDNKNKNQRLLCLDQSESKKADGFSGDREAECRRPVAMIQDLGATFGPLEAPTKIDLATWSKTPIWADAATCTISMQDWPRGGKGFPDVRISEQGRQFLATRLSKLSERQIRDLFAGARVSRYPRQNAERNNLDQWVRAFQAKERAIVDHAPCPAARRPLRSTH